MLFSQYSYSQGGLHVQGTFYSNSFLSPSVTPMFFPSDNSRIIVITPPSIDINTIVFPGISLQAPSIGSIFNIEPTQYKLYSEESGESYDLLKANHNYISNKTQEAIKSGAIAMGCKSVSRIGISYLKNSLLKACPIAVSTEEVPPVGLPTTVACAIGLALKNASVNNVAQTVVTGGCKVVVKPISKKIMEVTVETTNKLKQSVEEAKFWMAYLNSIDGMVWIMNNISRNP